MLLRQPVHTWSFRKCGDECGHLPTPSPQGLSKWPGSPVNAWGAAQAPLSLGLDGVVLHMDLEFCIVKSDLSGGWA